MVQVEARSVELLATSDSRTLMAVVLAVLGVWGLSMGLRAWRERLCHLGDFAAGARDVVA